MKNWLAILTIATLAGLVVVPWAQAVATREPVLEPGEIYFDFGNGLEPFSDYTIPLDSEPWDRRTTLEQRAWDGRRGTSCAVNHPDGEMCDWNAITLELDDRDIGIPCDPGTLEIHIGNAPKITVPSDAYNLCPLEWETPTP